MAPEEPQDQVEEHVEAEGEPNVQDEKVDWKDPSVEQVEGEEGDAVENAGVAVGLSPLGPMIQVVSPDGSMAQKVIGVDECFQLAGQLTALGTFIQHMAMQHQMQEQARLQQMMQEGQQPKQSKGGVYLS